MLYPSPGLSLFTSLPDSPIRAEWYIATPNVAPRFFAVAGSNLYEIFSDGTFIARGAVGSDLNPASLANSNIQLMIASGGQGYCLNLTTNVLTGPIATIAGAIQVGYSDGFFLALIANTAQVFVSNVLDGTTWNPATTAIVSVFPDNIVSMIVDHREMCLLGRKQSVCYYDSGNLFPYDVIPGGFAEQGCAATFSSVKADNTVYWIGQDERGNGIAWKAQGYTPVRVSTSAIEYLWQSYSTIADAIAYSFQDQGHTFIHWYFPTAGKSWRYDIATQAWHEVRYGENETDSPHRSRCHAFAFNKHLVGDWASGNIYQMAIPALDGLGGYTFVRDFGTPIRRIRRSPYVGVPEVWNFPKTLEFEIQTGMGPVPSLLFGGGYDSTLISSSGGASVPQLSVRLIVSSVVGHTYSITGTFKNVGAVAVVISIYFNGGGGSSSTTIAPGAVSSISLSLVGNGSQIRYGIGTANVGASFSVIGYNPTAQDSTISSPIAIDSKFAGLWTAFGSGATIALAQNQANPNAVEVAPQIMLRWSKDGGQTWSQERQLGIGKAGEYSTRMIARRLGRFWGTKGIIFELSTSDPVPYRIIDAYLESSPNMAPAERLPHALRKQA